MRIASWIFISLLAVSRINSSFLDDRYTILKQLFGEETQNRTKFEELSEKLIGFKGDNFCLNSLLRIGQSALRSLSNHSETDFEAHWTVRLIDALPTKPSGLSRKGPFFFVGDFETCKELWTHHHVHYCSTKGTVRIKNEISPITIGICAPSDCRSDQINSFLNFAKHHFLNESTITVEPTLCSNGNDETWSSKKPFVLFVICFVLGLLAIGTFTDKMNRDGLIKKSRKKMRRIVHKKSYRVNPSTNGSFSDEEDRSSGGIDASEEGSAANSSINRPQAPSIALTYRNISTITFSNSLLIKVLSAFSIRSSLTYLFRNSTRDVKLVNLFRVCSSFWVIFSHTCLFSLHFTDTVRSVAKKGESVVGWRNFMMNSSLAVDTFLFLSACVATFTIRKRLMFRGSDSNFSILKCFSLFFHRCLRFLPSLSLYLIFMTLVYNHLADGPFWNTKGMFGTECHLDSLWPHFAFLANFFPSNCVPWLWYISLDFQLYLTLPIIIFFVSKFRFGWIFVVISCIMSLTYRSLMYTIYTLPANMFVEMLSGKFEKAELSFKLLYTSPISRAPPFLIGILTGWYICQIRYLGTFRTITSISLKILAVSLLVFALFGPFVDSDYLIYPHAIVNRTIWAIGLSILIVLAQNGYNFGVFKVFGGQAFVVLSRLSFGVYLSHEPILLFYLNTLRQPMSPSSFGYFMFITISIYVVSVVFAFLIAISIEIPLLTLERTLFMTTHKLNEVELKERMERHVSFDTELEKYDGINEENEEENDDMDPEEKTRQWIETGQLCAQRSDIDMIERQRKEQLDDGNGRTSTSC